MLSELLAALAALSALLMLWQWAAGVCFPLDRRRPAPARQPFVSVLKPVKGNDPGTAEALESWVRQAYGGEWEILFGADRADDPAVPVVEAILARHPGARARLVVCSADLGANGKISSLIQMARKARGECLVLSDADARAPEDLLTQMIALLEEPGVGLVHCLYRLTGATTTATRWEAFMVNADFWSQVLQNRTLGPLRYGLGASMALRRADLEAIGGFGPLANVLADDHELGRRLVAHGRRTRLCPVVVDCLQAPSGWRGSWQHQLRWAVTIRACKPLPFASSILANGTLWPLLWLGSSRSMSVCVVAGGMIVLRIMQALHLHARFTRRRGEARWWMPPLKDLLQVALWAGAFLCRHVRWRDRRFRVTRDGRLLREELSKAGKAACAQPRAPAPSARPQTPSGLMRSSS